MNRLIEELIYLVYLLSELITKGQDKRVNLEKVNVENCNFIFSVPNVVNEYDGLEENIFILKKVYDYFSIC